MLQIIIFKKCLLYFARVRALTICVFDFCSPAKMLFYILKSLGCPAIHLPIVHKPVPNTWTFVAIRILINHPDI